MSRLIDGLFGPQWRSIAVIMDPKEYVVALCECYSTIPGIRRPYEAGLFLWQQKYYCHVSGIGDDGRRHLVEVFLLREGLEPEPVLAYQYPPPIAQWFPTEYQLLYDRTIATENVVPVPVGELADSLKQINRPAANARHRPDEASLPAERSPVSRRNNKPPRVKTGGNTRLTSSASEAQREDNRTAKCNVYAQWLIWQAEPWRYRSLTAFAHSMLALHDSLRSPVIVRRWCRAWQSGLAIPAVDALTIPCAKHQARSSRTDNDEQRSRSDSAKSW